MGGEGGEGGKKGRLKTKNNMKLIALFTGGVLLYVKIMPCDRHNIDRHHVTGLANITSKWLALQADLVYKQASSLQYKQVAYKQASGLQASGLQYKQTLFTGRW